MDNVGYHQKSLIVISLIFKIVKDSYKNFKINGNIF
jgi:hypothetical protein